MGFANKPVDVCRDFRVHARGKALYCFNTKYDEIVEDVPTSDNVKEIMKHVIIGFGKKNQLKEIRRHMVTVSELHSASQDDYFKRMHAIQHFLEILHHYFPFINPVTGDDFKDACYQAQPMKFKGDFTLSRMTIDGSAIDEIVE